MEGKQAEQEATNRRIDNTLNQAGFAITELNNILVGQQKAITEMSTAVNGEDDAIIQKSESTQAPFLKMNEAIFERSQTELLSSARTT